MVVNLKFWPLGWTFFLLHQSHFLCGFGGFGAIKNVFDFDHWTGFFPKWPPKTGQKTTIDRSKW